MSPKFLKGGGGIATGMPSREMLTEQNPAGSPYWFYPEETFTKAISISCAQHRGWHLKVKELKVSHVKNRLELKRVVCYFMPIIFINAEGLGGCPFPNNGWFRHAWILLGWRGGV